MNNRYSKKLTTAALFSVMTLGLAACGSEEEQVGGAEGAPEDGGTILWLSNLSSGVQYEGAVDYASTVAEELGYEFKVIYGDPYNDPAGNLNAVRNGITDDVVGLVASQDGGLKDIVAEYPELYVAGYNTDFRSVYSEGGANAELTSNEQLLGTIADGFTDGTLLGEQYAQAVIDKGYKKVGVVMFPEFAYPNLGEASRAFQAEIDSYNESAAAGEEIEIVGDTKVLEFAPLEESYFLEDGKEDLDAIVGFLAGTDFVYPTLKTAIANGSASADTKLITGGFNNSPEIVEDIGGDGVIQFLSISPTENIAWPIVMIDNALSEGMYEDYTSSEAIDSVPFVIDSEEDIENVVTESLTGTGDASLTQIEIEELNEVLIRSNPDATYEELKALFHSDQLTVDALQN